MIENLNKDRIELMRSMNNKRESLSEIISTAPHLYRRKIKILNSYSELVFEANILIATHPFEKDEAKLVNWKVKLGKVKKLESNLIFDSLVDLGGNH